MLAMNKIICVFLMSCFDFNKELTGICPKNCKCYSAPKGGYDFSQESISLICDDINDLSDTQLKLLEPINTLAVGINTIKRPERDFMNDLSHSKFNINNFYLYGTKSVDSRISFTPFSSIGLNSEALNVLTFFNLNIPQTFWTPIKQLTELKAIHIQDCYSEEINSNNFGILNALKIISVSIINSKLKTIDNKTFKDWNYLKMLSIVGNPLDNISWIKSKLPQLWYLNLKNNYITTIPEDLFDNLPKLRVLNLDDNNLKILTWNLLAPALPKLKEFSFFGTFETNTLCALEDVRQMYDKWHKYDSLEAVPAFFTQSMETLFCQDINNIDDAPPPYLCSIDSMWGPNVTQDQDIHLFCNNWKGNKKIS